MIIIIISIIISISIIITLFYFGKIIQNKIYYKNQALLHIKLVYYAEYNKKW